jgi:YbbR domain-containing protein
MVTVTGSPESLAKLGSLETEPVKFSGRSKSFQQRVHLMLPTGVSAVESTPILLSVEIAAPENTEHSGQGATAP